MATERSIPRTGRVPFPSLGPAALSTLAGSLPPGPPEPWDPEHDPLLAPLDIPPFPGSPVARTSASAPPSHGHGQAASPLSRILADDPLQEPMAVHRHPSHVSLGSPGTTTPSLTDSPLPLAAGVWVDEPSASAPAPSPLASRTSDPGPHRTPSSTVGPWLSYVNQTAEELTVCLHGLHEQDAVDSWVIVDRKDGASECLLLPKEGVQLKPGDRILISAEPVPMDLHYLAVRNDGGVAATLCLKTQGRGAGRASR